MISPPLHRSLILLSALALGACHGPQGDTGAPGADGLNGHDGIDGQNGVNGADGVDAVDGVDGVDGRDGVDGQDGVGSLGTHKGHGPWGVNFHIVSVDGASGADGSVQPGDSLAVTFSVRDDDGVSYDLVDLTRLSLQIAGPKDHYQVVVPSESLDLLADAVWNAEGTYTATVVIPDQYAPPANDTTAIGADQGDWGGRLLENGTYTIAGWAGLDWPARNGTPWFDAGNDTFDVQLGDATVVSAHEVVLEQNCTGCHGTLYAHEGLFDSLGVCVTCHVAGAEDGGSALDPSRTPGATIEFTPMVHAIHMGKRLTNGLVLTGRDQSGLYDRDLSMGAFPAVPTGPGQCHACHQNAAQGDVEGRAARKPCGSCHDRVNFDTGIGHVNDMPQPTDALCSMCHFASAVLAVHEDVRADSAYTPGLQLDLIDVTGGTGANGAFVAGDRPLVEYTVTNDVGAPVQLAELANLELVVAGPTSHMQRVAFVADAAVIQASQFDVSTGTWTATLPVLPAVYPPQANDTPAIGLADGDLAGRPLADGTYTVSLTASIAVQKSASHLARSRTQSVLFGQATALSSRDVVDEAACERCHGTIEHHDGDRQGLATCLGCHTTGAEDFQSTSSPTVTPGTSNALSELIHKVHYSSHLTQPFDVAVMGSPTYALKSFDVLFPRLDGGARACTSCHGASDAYTDASRRACLACHDSGNAAAHAALNTHPTLGEACDVCHGAGRDFAVETIHAWPN